MEVKYINFGTGNMTGDVIYLNKNLKKYPKLHDAILEHEKKHSGKFKLKDIMLDVKNEDVKRMNKEYYSFLLKYPKALANFLPVLKIDGTWYYDISLMLLWFFGINISILVWWFLT